MKIHRGYCLTFAVMAVAGFAAAQTITISNADLEDKIKGGWLGKTAGVCIGGPTEFSCQGNLCDALSLNFSPNMGEGYNQDDIYVQLTFIEVMDSTMNGAKGIFSGSMQDYGNAFANSQYPLWHANEAGRDNIRNGIMPPLSGMWGGPANRYNSHAEDIDWQIECDWVGLMCPAMPVTARALHDSVGHLMNYGNGLYGGYFLGACDALAFRYNDIHIIVKEALKCLPSQSQYYQIINDLVGFHDANPDSSWKACWRFINGKYLETTLSCGDFSGGYNINAGLNGAFVTIGLMYGDGDILKTIEYATKCGQDSDCNPSNAGAVVGTMLGYTQLPQAWKTSMEENASGTYANSNYTYTRLIQSSIDRARKAIVQMGGSESNGTWTINAETPTPPNVLEVFGQDPVPNASTGLDLNGGAPTFRPDGLVGIKGTIEVRIGGSAVSLPAEGVDRSTPGWVSVHDMRGREILSAPVSAIDGNQVVVLPAAHALARGCYILRLECGSVSVSKRVGAVD